MKLSCIVPTLNEEINVKEFLDGYIAQTQKFYEIIFVDGNSKDRTQEIIKKYMKENSEIKLIICEKKGLPAARNCGLDNSLGDYITTMDCDWRFLDQEVIFKISKEIDEKEKYIQIRVIYTNKEINFKGFRKYIFLKDPGITLTIIKRKENIRWEEEYGFGEDVIFNKKIMEKKIIRKEINDEEIKISGRYGDMDLKKILIRNMWYGRTLPFYLMKTNDWKQAIRFIIYIFCIFPIFWIIPFFKGFIRGLKNIRQGLDVPFGLGIIEIITAIGTSVGFFQYLFGIKHIGRDKN